MLHQSGCDRADDHSIVWRQSFEPGRDIRRFAKREMFVPAAAAHFADHHWPGMDAEPHRELYLVFGFQADVESLHGLDNAQAGVHRALGVVFMGGRVAEINEQAIAQVLGNVAAKVLDDVGRTFLISADDLA